MTVELQELLARLRDLKPEAIRSRLLEIEAEEKALRIILRTAKAAQTAPQTREATPCPK